MEVSEVFLQQIMEAMRENQSEADSRLALERLLERESGHRVFPDSAGSTLLRLTEQGRHQEAQVLLQHGAPPNYRDSHDGFTLLHVAVDRGDSKMVEILMKNGASASETCDTSETPLVLACLRENLQCVSIMLENGADPNTDTYDDGMSPLMAIVMNNKSLEILELLLKNGADPNRLMYHSGWHLESVLYKLFRDSPGDSAEEQKELCEYRVKAVRLLLRHGFRLQGHRDYLESLPELCLLHFSRMFPLAALLLERGEPFQPDCPWSHFDTLCVALLKSVRGRSEAEARSLLDKANALLDRAIVRAPLLRFTLRPGADSDHQGAEWAVDTVLTSLKSLCRTFIRHLLLPYPLEPKIQTLPLPNLIKDLLMPLNQD